MAQIQRSDVKPKIVTLPNCKNSIDNQGTIYVKACDLLLQGNWKKHDTFIELLESYTFKASGQCQLEAGEDPYEGYFVVGLSKDHNMGKVRTEKCPPQEERQEDLTNHAPGIMAPIAMGLCDPGQNVKFSLANAGKPTPQKGLIIYGVNFTPVKME